MPLSPDCLQLTPPEQVRSQRPHQPSCAARDAARDAARRRPWRLALCSVLLMIVAPGSGHAAGPATSDPQPNIVLIYIDDLGYADIGPFGGPPGETPHLDRLAREGRRFTDFVVSSAVCSASRAALLTGCYHRRIGISGALGPNAEIGINDQEVTLAEICRARGYATACYGKWHLGHHPRFLPLQHGFDRYFGLPYSNDMWPFHPDYVRLPADVAVRKKGYPSLPLIEDNRVVDNEVTSDDQEMLTTWYTERTLQFMEQHREQPFFVYLPHSMVHVPLFVSEKFRGKSSRGLFGDVLMEVDWSVGQILDALDRLKLADRTLVIFTSDNGPWLSYGHHAGSATPLREGKGTSFEGGIRVPTVMRWPGQIPAGTTCDELASTIDILPTVANLIGGELPPHPIDGHDISALLRGVPNAQSPHAAFYCYYEGGQLQAVRDRRWKLHLPHGYRSLQHRPGGRDGRPAPYQSLTIGPALFDLKSDVGETRNVAHEQPAVMQRLLEAAAEARRRLGDTLTGSDGAENRPAGMLTSADTRLEW